MAGTAAAAPARRSRGGGTAQEGGRGTNQPHITSFAAQVAEVSVDRETGEVKLLKLTTAHDIGRVINPIGHQGQINGGVIQGFGYAMMEEVRVEDGRVTTLSLGDYKLPNIKDIPELRTVLLESEDGYGPYGDPRHRRGAAHPGAGRDLERDHGRGRRADCATCR